MNYLSVPPTRLPMAVEGELPSEWVKWLTQLEEIVNSAQGTGATSQRPGLAPYVGYPFFDTTLGKPIWAKTVGATSTSWVFADGTAA